MVSLMQIHKYLCMYTLSRHIHIQHTHTCTPTHSLCKSVDLWVKHGSKSRHSRVIGRKLDDRDSEMVIDCCYVQEGGGKVPLLERHFLLTLMSGLQTGSRCIVWSMISQCFRILPKSILDQSKVPPLRRILNISRFFFSKCHENMLSLSADFGA